jgi:hypothetical protein
VPGAGFRTEEFVAAVVADVGQVKKIDPRFIFTLGWSSAGPPVYAASLRAGMPVTGSFVAMSIFNPDLFTPLKDARGHGYYVMHSPEDQAGGRGHRHTTRLSRITAEYHCPLSLVVRFWVR